MKAGSLFSGYGGLDMAVSAVLDADTVWHCEVNPAASRILAHHYPHVPNLGDITAVDWSSVEPVEVLTGGFPCQDVSTAGRRAGMRSGTRSGLWSHMAHAISQLRPRLVVIENVRGLLSASAHSDLEPCPWCMGDDEGRPPLRALGAVLGDLAVLGYDARWVGVRASDVGAPHARFRVFVVATDTAGSRRHGWAHVPIGGEVGGTPTPGHRQDPPAYAQGDGRDEGRTEPARVVGRHDAPERGTGPLADADVAGSQGPESEAGLDVSARGLTPDPDVEARRPEAGNALAATGEGTPRERPTEPRRLDRATPDPDWREYGPAIRRWERLLGRPAPCPHEPNTRGGRRLNPAFVEWLMGLPSGHVCGVTGITRNDQLRALGNGVVPQQAALALQLLLGDHA